MKFLGADDLLASGLSIEVNARVENFVAGNAVVAGDLCYLNSSGQMVDADASAEATSQGMLAIALETIGATSSGRFLLKGKITFGSWTAGNVLWVSETAAGITATAPSTSGAVRRVIGYARSASIFEFDPSKTWIVNT